MSFSTGTKLTPQDRVVSRQQKLGLYNININATRRQGTTGDDIEVSVSGWYDTEAEREAAYSAGYREGQADLRAEIAGSDTVQATSNEEAA